MMIKKGKLIYAVNTQLKPHSVYNAWRQSDITRHRDLSYEMGEYNKTIINMDKKEKQESAKRYREIISDFRKSRGWDVMPELFNEY